MDLLCQCEEWLDEDNYAAVIEALEPQEGNSPEADFILAKAYAEAYMNRENDDEDTEYIDYAKALLETIKKEFKEDPIWHYYFGVCLYFKGDAFGCLPHLKRYTAVYDNPFVEALVQELTFVKAMSDEEYTADYAVAMLLSEHDWNFPQFIIDMKERWNIEFTPSLTTDEERVNFLYDKYYVSITLDTKPLPSLLAEEAGDNNTRWEDAKTVAKNHVGVLDIAVYTRQDEMRSVVDSAKLATKVAEALCQQETVVGVYTFGMIHNPETYSHGANLMQTSSNLPLASWIWVGWSRTEKGINAFTCGMWTFGKEEMEIIGAKAEPTEVLDRLFEIAYHVISTDIPLEVGKTVGPSEDQQYMVTKSPSLKFADMMSLKIAWEPTDFDAEFKETFVKEKPKLLS